MNKISFTDILKHGSTLISSGKIINEDKGDLAKFIAETKQQQSKILKLKDLNSQQLKIMIKL